MLSSTDKEWLFKLLERNMRSMYQQVRARHVLDYLKSRIWNLSSLFKLLKRSIRSGVIRILGLTSIYASREAKTELLVCVLDQVGGSSEHTVIEDRQCTTSTCGVRMPQLRQRQWRRPVVVIQDG